MTERTTQGLLEMIREYAAELDQEAQVAGNVDNVTILGIAACIASDVNELLRRGDTLVAARDIALVLPSRPGRPTPWHSEDEKEAAITRFGNAIGGGG